MKNYVEGLEGEDKFITFYECNKDEIIIHFAKGKPYHVPMTKENLNIVKKRMEEQIKNHAKYEELLKNTKTSKIMNMIIFSLLFAGSLVLVSLATPTYIISLLLALIVIKNGYSLAKVSSKIKDLKKNVYFKEYDAEINDFLKNNNNVLSRSSRRVKQIVNLRNNISKPLSLNTIHKLKYKELRNIVESIKIEKEFNFDSDFTKDTDTPAKLIKEKKDSKH